MTRTRNIGILLFDDVEELDFVGPYEVFTMSNEMYGFKGEDTRDNVLLIGETGQKITCAKAMVVEPHVSIADAPRLDLLLIPGGQGTRREVNNPALVYWIKRTAGTCEWVTSVCTGSYLLCAAGLAEGKRVTTHWAFIDALREQGGAGAVLEEVRYVRDGNLVTAAGVSAGIDMALWLLGQMHGEEHARATQRGMQYDPAPPYAAAV
ncbi:DJ-1/PfpI family protein [Parvibaculum sp.]|uniref:DJ-1/PfpI family protein n=1 Tax=Parvibaculum sp. TaxID=2024848 RepID=UPI003C7441AD